MEETVLVLQSIFLKVDFVSRVPQHDAEYLKHATSVKVKKLASHKTFSAYAPSIKHAALKTLAASCLFA